MNHRLIELQKGLLCVCSVVSEPTRLSCPWNSVQARILPVQSLSCVWLFVTPWTATCHSSLSFTISWSLLRCMSIESVMLSNHLILCRPLLLLPYIFPSIGAFSNESSLHIRALELQLQDQSFQWIFRVDFLQDWLVWSPCCPRDSQEHSPAS